MYSASASSGQNPLTSTIYSTASLPTQVNLGSSDSDSFTFDSNSNRMTMYTFSVNGQSVVGSLKWSAIGTLESLGITDALYSGGNQTCSYTHDDVGRIASANCGSPWAQTFSYDAFGNVSKSGTISFQPTYSYLTNRMTQIGSSTPTYDANGNVLNDTAHTYTWDANGSPVSVDGVGLTFDAFGRMVEQDKAGVYTEIAYAPGGGKLAIMSGQTLQKAFVPLSGDSVAVYNSSGLAYYRHSDWLGSSRVASTPTRTLYFDGSYAPFGENYAQTGTTDLSFTGMNQDTTANLFDFPAREYNGIHGRWPSPDPAGLSAVNTADPQSFDRYGYVSNNPLAAVDPTGLCPNCRDDYSLLRNSYACQIEQACGWDPFDLMNIPVVAVGSGWSQTWQPMGGGSFPGGDFTINQQVWTWGPTSTPAGTAGDYGIGLGAIVGFPNSPWNLPRGPATRIPKVTGPNLQPEPPWPTDPAPPIKVPGDSITDSPVEGPIDIPEDATTLDRIVLGLLQAAKSMGGYMDGIICATCQPCQRNKGCA
jgi:RHS repeat-associated protein